MSRSVFNPQSQPSVVLACLALLVTTAQAPLAAARPSLQPARAAEQARVADGAQASDAYGRLPMAFEPNLGQTNEQVRYLARGRGYGVFVTDDETVLALAGQPESDADPGATEGDVLRVRIVGTAEPQVAPERELAGKVNYLLGDDESKWLRDVPTYAAVRLAGISDGVDAVFYGTQSQLEYDLVVQPGGDASQVRVRFEGQQSAEVDEAGDLVLKMRGGEVRQPLPAVFEQGEQGRRRVAARYLLTGDGEVSVEVGEYDRSRPLVIDPTLVYADFLGGDGTDDAGSTIAVDSSGAAYVAGNTTSPNFPTTGNTFDTTYGGGLSDGFLTKLSADGSSLVYSTYLGGSAADSVVGIAVDGSGAAYVTGTTSSTDFPTTTGAFDRIENGSIDAFATKLAAAGNSLVYSTFLGGAAFEAAYDIAVDSAGAAYVVGYTTSTNFPTTGGAFDRVLGGTRDAFVTKLAATGGSLIFSTYLGGSGEEFCYGVAVDASGFAFVTGYTTSTNFPTASPFQSAFAGGKDAFVTKVLTSGGSLVYSTYLGGSDDDFANAIAVDASGAAYVTGGTRSSDFPGTSGVFDTQYNENTDAFVTKVTPDGFNLAYGTFLGGSGSDVAIDIVVDSAGVACVTGQTNSSEFPTTAVGYDRTINGNYDAFVTKLSATASSLVTSTFLGGSSDDDGRAVAIDSSGAVYVAGSTRSTNFPTTPSAVDPTFNGGQNDAFVTKLSSAGNSLVYSTFLGAPSDDAGNAVAVDASGAAYVVGRTMAIMFPITGSGFDLSYNGGADDAFVTKLLPAGNGLVYSTYLGGAADDIANAVAVDASGAAFVVGATSSSDFPVTQNTFDTSANGGDDVFVAKLAPAGNALVYSTFVGGTGPDSAYGVAVDSSGSAVVAGRTLSSNFPTPAGAFDTSSNGGFDAFVTKLAPAGSTLAYSTYLGGSSTDYAYAVAVDGSGNAYVTGLTISTAFPTTAGAFDTTSNGGSEAWVAKLAAAGTALVYSTYLGGSSSDEGDAIAVDASGAAYVTGYTSSTAFPTSAGAFDTSYNGGGGDVFVTKLAANGATLVYSTYVGGASSDKGRAIAVDVAGAASVTGYTSSAAFPTTADAVDASYNGGGDAFVARVSSGGDMLAFSTFLGGSGDDEVRGLALDTSAAIYVAGQTTSPDLAASGFGTNDGSSAFVAKLTTAPTEGDTVGVYVASSGSWFLRNSNSSGPADLVFGFGAAGSGLIPLRGNWDGIDGDTVGLYDPVNSTFFLRNSNSPGAADLVFGFGPAGAGWIPLVGDWNGDGIDTIGLYDPSNGFFFLRNANAPGAANLTFGFGPAGAGWVPLTGDFDGNGIGTVGLYDPVNSIFFLRNANAAGPADVVVGFGPPGAGWTPLIGDWNHDGTDTVGLYSPTDGFFFLRNANAPGPADLTFGYGPTGVTPLTGDWDRHVVGPSLTHRPRPPSHAGATPSRRPSRA